MLTHWGRDKIIAVLLFEVFLNTRFTNDGQLRVLSFSGCLVLSCLVLSFYTYWIFQLCFLGSYHIILKGWWNVVRYFVTLKIFCFLKFAEISCHIQSVQQPFILSFLCCLQSDFKLVIFSYTDILVQDGSNSIMLTMMTSWNGNIFCVTGHLCGEFTGHWWIPRIKASDAELWCFLWSAPEYTVE